jgi:hypothetical protein
VTWERLLAALLKDAGYSSAQLEETAEGFAFMASIILSGLSEEQCNSSCKAKIGEAISDALQLDKMLTDVDNQMQAILIVRFGAEFTANGVERHADSFGQYLLERTGFHPALTPSAWFFAMLAEDPLARQRLASLPPGSSVDDVIGKSPTPLAECLVSILYGNGVSAGLDSHPPHCFRFMQAGGSQWQQNGKLVLLDDSMLPKLSPSLSEVKAEIQAFMTARGIQDAPQGKSNETPPTTQPDDPATTQMPMSWPQ